MTVAPGGTIVRDGDDYIVNSVHQYASGQAYATHFAGHAVDPETGQWSTFITPRGTWTVDDDWGDSTGLRGSGSHSVRLDNVRIPAGNVLVGRMQQDMIFEDGSPGFHLHGNPIYNGRTLGFFGLELVAITVGAVRGALDEYEKLMHTKRIFIPPFTIRSEDPYYQTWYGDAESRLIAAEAIVDRAGAMITAAAEREASGGAPFSLEEDFLINSVAHQAMVLAWNVMQDTLFKTAGTSASRAGSRLERIWRDVSQAWGHVNIVLHDWTAASYAQHHLGTVPQPPA